MIEVGEKQVFANALRNKVNLREESFSYQTIFLSLVKPDNDNPRFFLRVLYRIAMRIYSQAGRYPN